MSIQSFQPGDRRKTKRNIGEAPNLGKMHRTPRKTGDSADTRSHRTKHTRASRVALNWSIAIGVFSAALVVIFMIAYFKRLTPPPATTTNDDAAINLLTNAFASEEIQPSQTRITTLDDTAAIDLVKTALTNTDPAKVDLLFIRADDMDPQTLIDALENLEENIGKRTDHIHLGGRIVNHGYTEEVLVDYKNDEKTTNRVAQIWQGTDGQWRIDFDSFVRRTQPDLPTIIAGESETSVVRAFIVSDNFYNGVFSDDSEWQCFGLAFPDSDDIFYGYASRDSSQLTALNRIINAEVQIPRSTIEIVKLPNSSPRQFKISRVLAEDWSLGPEPFDESF